MKSAATRWAAALFLLVTGMTGPLTAADAPADPKSVDELLDRVEKTLQDIPAYSCELDIAIKVTASGNDQNVDCDFAVKVEKPRRWAIVKGSGPIGGTTVSDGKELTTYAPMLNSYAVEPLPEDWEQADAAESKLPMILLGPAGQAHAFMGRGFKKLLLDGVTESKVVGVEDIDDVPCWRCDFTQEGLNWKLWVTQEDQPRPRRVVAEPDYSAQPGAPEDMKMTVQLDLTEWQAEPKFTDEDFAFEPPADAKKVKSLMDAMPGMGPQAPHALVGEPAPTFEVEQLDGEQFKLGDVLGKQVVMLDFWATWCGPCVDALPEISAAAKEMEAKGVLFFTVNLKEEADAVREFLKAQELDVPVLLDLDGAIGEKYKAEAIPQTVLIGKDGRVQVVHVGFGGDAKAKLIEELTALVEGKELAKETLEAYEAEKKAAEEGAEDAPAEAAEDEAAVEEEVESEVDL